MTCQVSGNVQIGSAPPLSSGRGAGATAERNMDITLHHPRSAIVKMPALKFVRSVSIATARCYSNRLILTGLTGMGVFPSQLRPRTEVHQLPSAAIATNTDMIC
jgi:hypothetical protein